jgi:alkanesulfonate monooxygenase SsuD/methylene tetrahydromethanopterin reductase-like flavin-dependent oxidoreductase (luciferase family)
MLRVSGEIADGVLLNYLPASHVPWSVEQVRAGGDATIYGYIHCAVTDRDTYLDAGRKDLFSYAVVDAYAANFARAGFGAEVDALRAARAAKDREGSVAAVSDRMVDAIQIMGSADHVADAVAEYVTNGVEVPIVFPCPWGRDRAATVRTTMEAAINRL